ncbi:uncharacterized protein LOC143446429 [Clavelina lepadiformis]|uniref:uncharacterized protein LOC143446429 n=1 Tax=Clavelina lepadiformis TaxID=159417 RepID=UPI004043033A
MKFINKFHFMDMIAVAAMLQSCNGQYISTLTTPHPVQATNSTVVITAIASPTQNSTGKKWILSWIFNKTQVAQVGYAPHPNVKTLVESSSNYSERTNVSATDISDTRFTTHLTISHLKAEEDGYLMELAASKSISKSLKLTIRDCHESLSDGVKVNAISRVFNSPGKFACSNGGDLFYSNGTMLTSSDTTCLESAEWSGQDNLQCWTAPSVSLSSSLIIKGNKLTVIEENDMILTCSYNDVIPAGNTSQFYFGGKGNTKRQGQAFILSSLQRSDNNKVVSCQAVTPYTDVHPGSGRSSEIKLDVLYKPKTVVMKVKLSKYTIPTKDGYLLRSNKKVSITCNPSKANPSPICTWNFPSVKSTPISSTQGCKISHHLSQSSLVSCIAQNRAGSSLSNNQTITVVPKKRKLEFIVTGKNVTKTDGIVTSYLGNIVTFSCSVGFSDQLNTTYKLRAGERCYNKQSFDLTLKPSNTGNYSCTSMDSFGTYSASIYLDVLYAPDTVTSKIELSQYTIPTKDGYLLRSDKKVSITCNPSKANPSPTCTWNFPSVTSKPISSTQGCKISHHLSQSSLVSCIAQNRAGSSSSNELNITVVPEKRKLEFIVTGKNVTKTDGIVTSYVGEIVTFSCSIGFSDQLNTTYKLRAGERRYNKQSFDLTLKPSDTGNYSCTTKDNFGTYSSSIYLDVLHAPDTVTNKVELSRYKIVAEDGYLLRSDENLTMQCISEANPSPTCTWTIFSLNSQSDISIPGCNISYNLDQSSLIYCTAENEAGSKSSNVQTVTVVPAQRSLEFKATGSNITNTGRFITSYLGENVAFSCSIEYSDRLNTTFLLKRPGRRHTTGKSFALSLESSDTGNYSCTTEDSFGSYSSSIYLDVIYTARQHEGITCNWNVNESGSCVVVFCSNPKSQFVLLTKNDLPVTHDGSTTIQSDGDQQTFTFSKTEVLSSDNGTYTLTVRSLDNESFPENALINFTIVVADGPLVDSGIAWLQPVIIGGSVVGVFCLCVMIFVIVQWRRGAKKTDEKEERINPLYGSSESPDQVEAAYAEVDKKKKKKKKG